MGPVSFLAGSMKVARSLRASRRASGTVRVSALAMVAERMRPRTLRRTKNERFPLVPTRRPRPEITSSQTSYFLARGLAVRDGVSRKALNLHVFPHYRVMADADRKGIPDAWGAFSNFQPMVVPIAAGPWTFATSEALYQARKFAVRPDIQQRIAEAPTPGQAAAIGRTPGLGIDPGWAAQRVNVMRCVLRLKRKANPAEIDALLAATRDRPIVEVSARDPWWGARPVAGRYEGRNVLGRLWMELRDGDPAARSGAWLDRVRVGRLAYLPGGASAARETA